MVTIKEKAKFTQRLAGIALKQSKTQFEEHVLGHEQNQEKNAEEFCKDLESLGPAFIKLGQTLAGRSDLLPQAYFETLASLQEDVTPADYEEIAQIVEEDLGKRPEDLFAEFPREPLASASLGQVYRAVTHQGKQVAVKVRRPGVKEELQKEFSLLTSFADILSTKTDFGRDYQIDDMVHNLEKSLFRELDYRRERRNLERFQEYLSDYQSLRLPHTYPDLCSERVLTMEYMESTAIKDTPESVVDPANRLILADRLFKAYLHQVLVRGTYHADPHPGNVRITPDGKLALLDLGMVGHVTEELKYSLALLLLQLGEKRSGKVAQLALQIGETDGESDCEGFRQAVIDAVDEYSNLPLDQMEAGAVVLNICQMAAAYRIHIPAQLSLLAKTLTHLDEVGKALAPNFNPNQALRRHVKDILMQVTSDWATLPEIAQRSYDFRLLLTHGPSMFYQLLDSLSKQNFRVEIDALDETNWLNHLQKLANRLTAGLIIAAMIVGGALLAHVPDPSHTLLGYPAVAIVSFLLAFGAGGVLAFRILWSDKVRG